MTPEQIRHLVEHGWVETVVEMVDPSIVTSPHDVLVGSPEMEMDEARCGVWVKCRHRPCWEDMHFIPAPKHKDDTVEVECPTCAASDELDTAGICECRGTYTITATVVDVRVEERAKMCCDGHECGCMGRPIEPPCHVWVTRWVVKDE